MVTRFNSDIDIDVADRDKVLSLVKHVKAMQCNDGVIKKHASGIYPVPVPYDPMTGLASIDYKEAEERGYPKIDLLNMSVYTLIRDYAHYEALLAAEIPWHRLKERKFCEQVVHIGSWFTTLEKLSEPVNTLPRLAMFLSVIRPGKKHLLGQPWKDVATTVWEKDADGLYTFRKSHAVAYAHLVSLHMRILHEMSI